MSLVTLPRQYTADINGEPRVGARMRLYDAGTNNLRVAYTTKAYTIEHSQPIESVEGGIFPAVHINPAGGDYKIVIQDASGATISTDDNIAPAIDSVTSALIGSTLDSLKRTAPEIAAGVTPVNYAYPPGYVYRYGTNANPGTTDMTVAINTAADVCRQGKYTLVLPPETCLVSSSLNFSGIHVRGDHLQQGPHIKASSAQFDVITSTGNSSFSDFYVDGGWDEVTTGQSGDVFSLKNAGGFAYVINFFRVSIARAKKRFIYWEKGGYGLIFSTQCNSAGLHGIELVGFDPSTYTTTISIGGNSTFTGCPNGYGAKITECAVITFRDVIMEATGGIIIGGGGDNQLITFDNVYQEFGHGTYFLNFNATGGRSCRIVNCYGGGKAISDPGVNWEDVYIENNRQLVESAVPLANRILQHNSGQLLTSTTGGVDVTAASLSLIPGVYLIHGTVQTVTSTATTLTQAACQLTTNVAESGLNNSVGGTFSEGAAQANYNPGASLDQRLSCFAVMRLTATTTVYLRARFTFSGAGNLAYNGMISAVKFQ